MPKDNPWQRKSRLPLSTRSLRNDSAFDPTILFVISVAVTGVALEARFIAAATSGEGRSPMVALRPEDLMTNQGNRTKLRALIGSRRKK